MCTNEMKLKIIKYYLNMDKAIFQPITQSERQQKFRRNDLKCLTKKTKVRLLRVI